MSDRYDPGIGAKLLYSAMLAWAGEVGMPERNEQTGKCGSCVRFHKCQWKVKATPDQAKCAFYPFKYEAEKL